MICIYEYFFLINKKTGSILKILILRTIDDTTKNCNIILITLSIFKKEKPFLHFKRREVLIKIIIELPIFIFVLIRIQIKLIIQIRYPIQKILRV